MRLKTSRLITITLALALAGVLCFGQAPKVKIGADLLFEKYSHLIDGKKVGLIANHTALLASGKHLADSLQENRTVTLVALFGPEHGIRGNAAAGATVQDGKDERTGVPVYSLYGKTKKPTPEMFKGIDILLFDIQSVGARFYTYESTMSLAMEAAAENNIPFVVLDRPNPIRGTWVEGFVLEDSLASFVGMHPIPIAHGMTMGELAKMINEAGWLADSSKANLTVVPMENWERSKWYDETGLRWVPPSPNIPTLNSAIVYPGMCLVEGTNLSEGRGTERPFQTVGAPFISGTKLARRMNAFKLPGVVFEPITFTPIAIPGVAENPKHKGKPCGGVYVRVTDRNSYEPVKTAVYVLSTIKAMYPKQFEWRTRSIALLAGTHRLREAIDSGVAPDKICEMWEREVQEFKRMKEKCVIY
ncbi:MAG: DUF1343 domain-containing protein [Ignavibacteriae bacterium]|nr:DUF1343 domain-containing protein [Ignavibacteriota bacterium]